MLSPTKSDSPIIDVSSTTNLALVHYTTKPYIFACYINLDNEIAGLSYIVHTGWLNSTSLNTTVYPGSSLAATMTLRAFANFPGGTSLLDPSLRILSIHWCDYCSFRHNSPPASQAIVTNQQQLSVNSRPEI